MHTSQIRSDAPDIDLLAFSRLRASSLLLRELVCVLLPTVAGDDGAVKPRVREPELRRLEPCDATDRIYMR
jgi:hypothetical protein